MTNIPVAYRANKGQYNFLGTTSLLNAYAAQLGTDAKAPYAAVPCHGTLTFSAVTDTPTRGGIYMEDLDAVYTTHSSSVWKLTSAGVATRIGTIPGIDRVQIVRNQKATPQIVVKCTAGLYIIESDIVTKIDDPDLPTNCVSIESIAGYIVFGFADGRYFISSQNEASQIDALDFASAEQAADKLKRLKVVGGALLVLGSETIEPWVNSGNADFPFELRSAMSITPKGCLAADSVEFIDNTIFWVGNDRKVYRLEGYTAKKVSSEQVDRLIQGDPNQDDIVSTSYSRAGHDFYVITGNNWSMQLDLATSYWAPRESYTSTRWRHDHAISAWDKVLIGDRNTGTIYYFDENTFTEAGDLMLYGVDMPPLHAFPNGGRLNAVHLDFVTGQGKVLASQQGFDPIAMVSVSRDGGNTYSNERQIKLGKSGNYRKRVNTRRLGRFEDKGCNIRIRVSDPVGRALALVDANVTPLKQA